MNYSMGVWSFHHFFFLFERIEQSFSTVDSCHSQHPHRNCFRIVWNESEERRGATNRKENPFFNSFILKASTTTTTIIDAYVPQLHKYTRKSIEQYWIDATLCCSSGDTHTICCLFSIYMMMSFELNCNNRHCHVVRICFKEEEKHFQLVYGIDAYIEWHKTYTKNCIKCLILSSWFLFLTF